MKEISKLKDEEVVVLVRESDKELYSEIIKRYESRLLRYAEYLIGDYNEASDIIQNSFIKAYIKLNSFNTKKKFSSWIYRIVHNEAMNLIIKNKKRVSIDEDFDLDSGIDLEDDVIKKELKSHARNCLKQMPVMYSEPLTLYFLDDRSYEEISDILRIPKGTVATRISRAKSLMKKICQK